MRKIREILTHRYTHGLSFEKTALAVKKSKGCVYSTCAHFEASGLTWPLPPNITDEELETAVFPEKAPVEGENSKTPLPDLAYIEQELTKKNVTIQLLYREYKEQHTECMSQASFYVIARPTHVSPPPRLYNINIVTYKGGYMSRTQSKYDWPHHIAQQKSSGLSVKEYSAQHGFSPLSFYVNRKKLMKPALPPKKETAQAMPSFLNLGTLRQRNSVLISFPDGTRVEINGEQSTEHLCSILKTLRTKGGTRC